MLYRAIESTISKYLTFFPVVAVIGARQCGKTTVCKKAAADWQFYDLEKGADYDSIAHDPDLFLRINHEKVVFDEAQLMPELFSALRVAVDADRSNKGRYIITGSSSPELLSAISESLAGRIGIIEMSPLSASEISGTAENTCLFSRIFNSGNPGEIINNLEQAADINKLHDYWFQGGYPELWVEGNPEFTEVWFPQYIQTFVNRDLRRHFPNINHERFRLFLQLLSGLSGEIINYSKVARLLGVSQPTVKDYFYIAHHTFIWRTLRSYEKNSEKQITRHPKGYIRDSGLLHHQLRIKEQRDLLAHPAMGSSWEGMVIEQILRGLNADGMTYTPYHYRTKGGSEIDLILESSRGVIPVEIKYSSRVNKQATKGVEQFCRDHKLPLGLIIHNGEKVTWYTENVVGIPFSHII
ncbi:MAG: ATP-binding protein [Planctomycetota bacterium]|jgi:predicted AAA+ superfamily ATPase